MKRNGNSELVCLSVLGANPVLTFTRLPYRGRTLFRAENKATHTRARALKTRTVQVSTSIFGFSLLVATLRIDGTDPHGSDSRLLPWYLGVIEEA